MRSRSILAASWIGIAAITAPSLGQDVPPPPPPGSTAPPQVPNPTPPASEVANPGSNLDDLAGRMADRLQDFADDVAADLPPGPDSQGLGRNASELGQAVRDFRAGLAKRPDLFGLRQSFSGIDAGWNGLMGELGGIPNCPAALTRSAKRIDQIESQICQLVGLNPSGGDFYQAPAPGSGPSDPVRLAAALADRSASLASAIHQDAPTLPDGLVLAQDADQLAREADSLHDSLSVDPRPGVGARAYGPVRAIADRIGATIAANPNPPPALRSAWSAYVAAQGLFERSLGPVPPDAGPNPNLAPPAVAVAPPVVAVAPPVVAAMPGRGFQLNLPGARVRVGGLGGVQVQAPGVNINTPGVGPVVVAPPNGLQPLADALVGQIGEYLAVAGQTAGTVPQGGIMLADAQQLQAAAIDFQRDVASGFDPGRLAFEFRPVDVIWQRLARRVNRVAKGRVGPNVAQVYRIGDTVSQIHQNLGLPGYPGVVQRYP